jgi:type III secretion protein V
MVSIPPVLIRFQQRLARHQDLALVALVVAVIMLMLFPLPYAVMDGLIAANIAVSVLILMTAIYVPAALELSTFPSLLLFTTLLRLGLNIASTKLILLHAHAGQVIETFGRLVVGGNYVVGGVVFLIITIVQFVVIAKGSERVAEVGARFTLDAMPGKQMSIDADLRAGLMNGNEAGFKRRQLERESQLHGGMDGAMKFVKGDAIASLIISLISIVAGIAIGVLMKDMPVAEAARRYSILTVGDGMVSQIPSLFVSIAAGVLVTRVAGLSPGSSNLGRDIGQQLTAHPKALVVAGSIVLACALIPGFPKIQFLLLALALGGGGVWLMRRDASATKDAMPTMPSFLRDGAGRDAPYLVEREASSGPPLPLAVKVTEGFARSLQPSLLEREMFAMRQRLADSVGIPFPGIRLLAERSGRRFSYALFVHGVPIQEVVLPEGGLAVAADAGVLHGLGIKALADAVTVEGVCWVPADARSAVASRQLRLLTHDEVLVRHVEACIRENAVQFIGLQETRTLLARAEIELPDLTAELNKTLPLPRVADALRRLVDEGVLIKDLRTIFEALVAWGGKEKDPVLLVEHVRMALGPLITHQHAGEGNTVQAILLAPRVEDAIRQSVQDSGGTGYVPAISPEEGMRMSSQIREIAAAAQGGAVLVTHFDIRRCVKKMLEPYHPALPVLSFQEISAKASLAPLGQVEG